MFVEIKNINSGVVETRIEFQGRRHAGAEPGSQDFSAEKYL